MTSPRAVLVTRPQPGADETAARLRALGFLPIIAPMLRIELRSPPLPPSNSLQAVLITSGNALPALTPQYKAVRLVTVGDATADRARRAGFLDVFSAGGDADALAALARAQLSPRGRPILTATAVGQGQRLAAALRASGFRVLRRAIYAAKPVRRLPSAACEGLEQGQVAAALFFSAETAQAFVRASHGQRLQAQLREVDAVAIGQPAAVALEALPWRSVRTAPRPTLNDMLALLSETRPE